MDETARALQDFLIQRRDRGQLVPAKLAMAMGYKGPSMVTMILSRERAFPMQRIDRAAAFFQLAAEELIALAKEETRREQTAEPPSTRSAAVDRFRQRPTKTVDAPHVAGGRKRGK